MILFKYAALLSYLYRTINIKLISRHKINNIVSFSIEKKKKLFFPHPYVAAIIH